MNNEIKYQISNEYLGKFYNALLEVNPKLKISLYIALTALVAALVLFCVRDLVSVPFIVTTLTLISIVEFSMYFYFNRFFWLRKIKKTKTFGQGVSVMLGEEELTLKTNLIESKVNYKLIDKISETNFGILLHLDKGIFYFFEKDIMHDSTVSFLKSKIIYPQSVK